MLNRNALRAEIVKNGYTQQKVAEKIGMSEATFYRKMRDGSFALDEAGKLIKLLDIKDPTQIFFASKLT